MALLGAVLAFVGVIALLALLDRLGRRTHSPNAVYASLAPPDAIPFPPASCSLCLSLSLSLWPICAPRERERVHIDPSDASFSKKDSFLPVVRSSVHFADLPVPGTF